MSSKQLESILGRVTSATPKPAPKAAEPAPAAPVQAAPATIVDLAPEKQKREKAPKAPAPRQPEPERAIQAYVPLSVAKAVNLKAAQDDVTVRTIILQGLKAIGIEVADEHLRDRRR